MWSYTWFCVILIYFSVTSEFVQSAYNNGSSGQQLVSSRTHTDVGPNHRTKVTSSVYRSNHGISYHQVIDQQHVRGGTHTKNGKAKGFGKSEQNDLPSQQHVYAQKHEVTHSDMNVSHQHHSSNVRVPSTSLDLEKLFKKEQTNFPSQQHVYRMRDSQKHQRHVRHVKHSTNRNTEELIRNEQNLPSRHNHHNGHRVPAPQGNQPAQQSGRDVKHSGNSGNTEFIQNEQHSSSPHHNHQSGHGASHPHQHHGSDSRHSTNTEFINNEQNSHHGASHPQGHQHHGSNARQHADENTKLIKNEQDSSSHQHNHRGNPQGVAQPHGATHPQGVAHPHGATHPQGVTHPHGAAHPHQQHQGGNATGYENAADFIKNERLVESPDSKDKKQEKGRMTLTVTPTSTEPPKFLPKTEIVISSPLRSCPPGTMRDWSGRCRDLFN